MKKFYTLLILLNVALFSSAQTWQINSFDYSNLLTPGYNVLLPDSTNQVWQVGKSAKFDGVLSTKPALYTDTLGSYPTSMNESVTMVLYAENFGQPAHWYDIRFTHRFETDSLMDGGFVEISLDSGATWVNAIDYLDSVPWSSYNFAIYCDFPANTYLPYGQRCAFTGNGKSFRYNSIHMEFMWSISPKPEVGGLMWPIAPYLRFAFASDSLQTNKAGWQIDEVEIWGTIGFGIEERINPIYITPNPSNGVFKLESLNHSDAKFVVSDSQGRVVLEDKMQGTSAQINLSNQAAGMYIVRFEDGFTVKLMKE